MIKRVTYFAVFILVWSALMAGVTCGGGALLCLACPGLSFVQAWAIATCALFVANWLYRLLHGRTEK